MNGPATYEHLPTRKRAWQYDGHNGLEISLWSDGNAYLTDLGDLVVLTKQGEFTVSVGDFVVHDPHGGWYMCPEATWLAEYKLVDEHAPAGERS